MMERYKEYIVKIEGDAVVEATSKAHAAAIIAEASKNVRLSLIRSFYISTKRIDVIKG